MFSLTVLGLFSAFLGASAAPTSISEPYGAVYAITNDPQGNHVLASYVSPTGSLTYGSATFTKGVGLHGNTTNPNAGDPLFSQDAVKVWKDYLFIVNSGSNTIVMFYIDPTDPTKLALVGEPVSSGGEFPLSVAVSPSGQLCVLNGGAVSNVNCFGVDYKKGLIPWAGTTRDLALNQTTPPTGAPGTASDIIFNEDGSKLIAAVKGFPENPGYLATWSVSPEGALSEDYVKSSTTDGGERPFSLTVIPGRNAIFNTDPAIGFAVWNFDQSPAIPTVVNVTNSMGICWSSYSSKSNSFLLSDPAAATIDEVVLDEQLNGTVINQYALPTGSGPLDIIVGSLKDKEFLFVLSAGTTTIDVLSLDGTGSATVLPGLNITAAVNGAVSVSATNLQGMAFYARE